MSWEKVKFSKLYEIPSRNGLTKPSKVRGTGYKMINMGELFANNRIYDIPMELVPLTDSEKKNCKVERNDLLFARQSLVLEGAGKCSIVMESSSMTVFESHLIRIRLNRKKAHPMFYYYYFLSPCSPIKSIVSQCAQAGIRGSDLGELYVELPLLTTQRQIADVLSAYDDLIENNRKQIKLLEEAAQRLYKEWFVDLRFPGHEHTKIVDGVPEGWTRHNVNEVVTFHRGYDLTKENMQKGPYPVVGSTSVIGYHDKYKISGPGIVTGRSGSLGQFQLIWENYWPHNTSLYISDFKNHNIFYVFSLLQTLDFSALNNGGAIPTLNRNTLSNIEIIEPQVTLQDKYSAIAGSLYGEIKVKQNYIKLLVQARDRLLPKLMSGEVEV